MGQKFAPLFALERGVVKGTPAEVAPAKSRNANSPLERGFLLCTRLD
jgi:hypothetical protein